VLQCNCKWLELQKVLHIIWLSKKYELVIRRCMELFRDPHWSVSVSSGTDIIRSPQVLGFSNILLAQFIQGHEGKRENATRF
jgi:hypothetical protein